MTDAIENIIERIREPFGDNLQSSHSVFKIACNMLYDSGCYVENQSALLQLGEVPKCVIPSIVHESATSYFGGSDEIEYMITPVSRSNKKVNLIMPVSFLLSSSFYVVQDSEPDVETRVAVDLLLNRAIPEEDLNYLCELNSCQRKNESSEFAQLSKKTNGLIEFNTAKISAVDIKLNDIKDELIGLDKKHAELVDQMKNFIDALKNNSDCVLKPKDYNYNVDFPLIVDYKDDSALVSNMPFDDLLELESNSFVKQCQHGNLTVTKFPIMNRDWSSAFGLPVCFFQYITSRHVYWYLMVAKGCSNTNLKYKDSPLVDLISDSVGLEAIGFKSVNSALVSTSLLSKRIFRPGFCSGKYGSIERKYSTYDSKFQNLIDAISVKMQSISDMDLVVEFAVDRLVSYFSAHEGFFRRTSYFIKSVSFRDKYNQNLVLGAEIEHVQIDNSSIGHRMIDILKNIPKDFSASISQCVRKCVLLRTERRNMMYGSMVLKKHNHKFVTPCGIDFSKLCDYVEHPCTIRSRAIGIVDDPDSVYLAKKNKSLINIDHRCTTCGRVYKLNIESALCELFCTMIRFGVADKKDFSMQNDPITAIYGDYTSVKERIYSDRLD